MGTGMDYWIVFQALFVLILFMLTPSIQINDGKSKYN